MATLSKIKRGEDHAQKEVFHIVFMHHPLIHTCISRFDCMTSFSPTEYIFFYFAKHVMQVRLMIPYLELHNLLDGRIKKRQYKYALVRGDTPLSNSREPFEELKRLDTIKSSHL